jgi:uncharacterized protein
MKRSRLFIGIIFLTLLVTLCTGALFAQNIPPAPNPPRLVNDLANVLSPQEEEALERKLVAYDDSTSNQVAIVLIETLNDYPIEEYSLRLFREWKIGNKKTNNGVLILAAIADRRIRIEPGYGLEGAIPDITANTIITNDIAPAFRDQRYFEGLNAATNSIIAAAAGEYQAPEGYGNRGEKKRGIPIGMLILGAILIYLFSNRNRGGGGGFMSRRGYRRGWGGPIIFPGGFGGGGFGGGGGGFGGGGFGGFGGGSSGGGGASGSW